MQRELYTLRGLAGAMRAGNMVVFDQLKANRSVHMFMAFDEDEKEKGEMPETPIEEILDETADDEDDPLIAPDEEEKGWE